MSFETERKFLVASQEWRSLAEKPSMIRQGYLNRDPERVVRIRQMDDRAFITIKNSPGKIESDKLRRANSSIPSRWMMPCSCLKIFVLLRSSAKTDTGWSDRMARTGRSTSLSSRDRDLSSLKSNSNIVPINSTCPAGWEPR